MICEELLQHMRSGVYRIHKDFSNRKVLLQLLPRDLAELFEDVKLSK